MPKIVNLHGVMASGKSTIVEILNKKLKNYSYVDRAYIKKMLKPAGRENARKISKKATFLIIKELMKLKKNILVQELNPIDLKRKLRPYFKKFNYKLISFHLYCSLNTSLKRDKSRTKKTRGDLVRKTHYLYSKPEKIDFQINTDKLKINESVGLIIKKIKEK
ncbi:AAA family ATPase [Candidatus Woesearchaeota archaeon]|nr:AAA family ATPase [Candidatus Woesearchaeota archaeon]